MINLLALASVAEITVVHEQCSISSADSTNSFVLEFIVQSDFLVRSYCDCAANRFDNCDMPSLLIDFSQTD